MSPIRPKAVDGVVVHHPRVAKTPTTRRPRKVELSDSLIREQEETFTQTHFHDHHEDGDDTVVTQTFITKLRSHYENGSSSEVHRVHYAVALIAIIFLIFFMGYKGEAQITIYPKEYTKTVTIPASQFEQKEMVITESLKQQVATSGMSDVAEKAMGVVTLVNEEPVAQKFRAATRLEGTNKLIYFMENKETVVPAKVGDKPGTVDVTITAEKAGPEYNIEKTDFVVPGWREISSTKFTTQYAHSKTAIAGGFIGKKAAVDPAQKEAAIASLKQAISKRVEERSSRELPEMWFTLSKGELVYAEPVLTSRSETESELSVSASVTYKIANRVDVGRFVSKQEAGLDQYTVIATNTAGLVFDGTKLDGTVIVKPLVPEALYKQKLLGQKKGNVKALFASLPELSGMEIKLTPFWKRVLPSNPAKIIIKS